MPENDIKRSGLKLKKNYYEAQAQDNIGENRPGSETEPSSVSLPTPLFQKRDSSRTRWHNLRLAASWLFFIALGGSLIYVRFFSDLPGVSPDLLKQYGMIAVGAAYLVSIFLAIKDNMFDGLLAIVVPFYPFYYLFFTCGSIFLRVLTAALLVAFGFDCLLLLQNIALKMMDRTSYLIRHI